MTVSAFAFGWPERPQDDLVRAAKAALLYADEVTADAMDIQWSTPWTLDAEGHLVDWESPSPNTRPLERLAPELWLAKERGVLSFWPEPGAMPEELPEKLRRAIKGSALWSAIRDSWREEKREVAEEGGNPGSWIYLDPDQMADSQLELEVQRQLHVIATKAVPVFASSDQIDRFILRPMLRPNVAEGAFANHVLASLPAFPDADMDVILDVRDRLADARTRFQAAVSGVADDLNDVPSDELNAASRALHLQHVAPAVLEVRETLEELNALPTLLRVVGDKSAAQILTGMAIALSAFDFQAAGASSAALSSLAREASARRGIAKEAERMPFWYLHAADRLVHQPRD